MSTDDASPSGPAPAPGEVDDAAYTLGAMSRLCGAVIALAAVLPVTPDGRSFLALLRAELAEGLLRALMMLAGFGSPFLFGLAVALVGSPKLRALAIDIVRAPIGLVHGQLLLVGFVVWR